MKRKCSSLFIRVVCSFHYQWIHFIRNVKKKNIVVMSFIYLVTKKNRSYSIWWRFFFLNDTCGKKEKNEEQAAKKKSRCPRWGSNSRHPHCSDTVYKYGALVQLSYGGLLRRRNKRRLIQNIMFPQCMELYWYSIYGNWSMNWNFSLYE